MERTDQMKESDMADYDDLLARMPIDDIARTLGVDADTASDAVQQVLPGLVGGLEANAHDPAGAASLEKALAGHSNRPRLRSVDEVDTDDGAKIVGHVFGPNTDQVAARLADASPRSAVTGDLIQKVLPIVAPIVLAWVADKFFGQKTSSGDQGGGLGDLLGGLLGGGSSGGSSGGLDLGGLLGGLLGGGSR